MEKFRLLRPDEIDVRVGNISEKGISLLLYLNARCAMDLLDERFKGNWQRTHQLIGDWLFCTISVWDEEKQKWISKQDVGVSGFSEVEKSASSDSFKRAAVNVGIGRELYSAPFIWVSSNLCNIQRRGERYACYDKFSVKEISYSEDRVITGLTIVNENTGKEVFKFIDAGKKPEKRKSPDKERTDIISEEQIKAFESELERTGVTMEEVASRYRISNCIEDIPEDIYKKIMTALKRTKSKSAA